MKAIWSLLLSSILMVLILGCEEVERENPLDPQNQRTGGAPPGLTGRAGDGRVILSWPNLGLEGVKEYKLYRAHLTPDPDQFEYIDFVLAGVYEYRADMPSDPSNFHFYRVSYVDNEKREVPLSIMVRVDGKQVILSWQDLGLDVIKEYRIYRARVILTPDQFQYVASMEAKPLDKLKQYVYADTGLQNDYGNLYLYRLSYADSDGRETPDPQKPLNLNENWFLIDVIPSESPPAPDVRVVEDIELQKDLQVHLLWDGYLQNAPEDLAGFKIYSALKAEEGEEQTPLTLVAEVEPNVEYYVDGNDYKSNIINFHKDNVTKLYKVVAFDAVGVESDSPIVEGTSPNLPPSSPQDINIQITAGSNNYKARITWRRNPEPDMAGYVLYELGLEGELIFKQVIHDPNANSITITDSYLLGFMVKEYYLTAFDNTPRPDGKRDESLTMQEQPEPVPTDLEEPSVGDLAPDFTLLKLDGGTMSLQDTRGKVVLMDFWATWCGPCVAEVPHLQDLYEKYKARGLVVLGINTWENADIQVVKGFTDEHGLTYEILLDMDENVASLYNVDAIPSVWILDRNGIITWKSVGYGPGGEEEIEQQILAVL